MYKDQYNTQPGITYPTQEMTHPGCHFPIFLLQVNNILNLGLIIPIYFYTCISNQYVILRCMLFYINDVMCVFCHAICFLLMDIVTACYPTV